MSDGASFIVSMVDKISGPAKASEKSLATLDAQIKKDAAGLKALEGAMSRLNQTGSASTERMGGLEKAIAQKKAAMADATNKIADMAGKEEHAAGASDKLAESTTKVGGASEGAAGDLGALGGAAAGVAVALAAVVVVVGAVVLKMAAMSLAARDAYDSQVALALAETDTVAQAHAVVDAQQKVASGVAMSQAAVFELGNALLRAGVSNKQYQQTLKTLAEVSSVAGEEAIKPIEKLIKKSEQLGSFKPKEDAFKGSGIKIAEVYQKLASDLGISVEQVKAQMAAGKITVDQGVQAMNEALSSKFGAAAKTKLLSFDTQIMKFKENIGNLFKNVDATPFLQALSKLLGLFDSNTATGKNMQSTITSGMNAFFRVAARVVPMVEGFFLSLATAVLDVQITMHPLINSIKKALGFSDKGTSSALDTVSSAGEKVGQAIGFVLTGVLLVIRFVIFLAQHWEYVAGAMALAAAAISPLIMGAIAFGGVILGVQEIATHAGHAIVGVFKRIGSTISSAFDGVASIGTNLIDGLVAGIEAGASRVAGAVKGVAKGAIDAGKSVLGIASPSKVFRQMGHFTSEGFSLGIEGNKSRVSASVKHLVQPPPEQGTAQAWRERAANVSKPTHGGGGGGHGMKFEKGAITLHVHAPGGDAKGIEAAVERVLERAFERMATQAGGAKV